MQEEQGHRCIICGHYKSEGILILSEYICDACEAEMVQTDATDAKYHFFIHQLKQLWVEKNA
ncbi:sigma factor G inhibitor Gin [Paenibacillus terreus]|uniref:Sigma factor G inhibitor Gin n=1 Tax=Paenibacillus terreus TaxID=1387834 RepID=A0ABV5BGJ6_9BACL